MFCKIAFYLHFLLSSNFSPCEVFKVYLSYHFISHSTNLAINMHNKLHFMDGCEILKSLKQVFYFLLSSQYLSYEWYIDFSIKHSDECIRLTGFYTMAITLGLFVIMWKCRTILNAIYGSRLHSLTTHRIQKN
jgi:hypothetical protein